MDRRAFLVRAVSLSAAGVALGGTAYAMTPGVRVDRLLLRFPGLPDAFDGIRMLQLSDLHMGTYQVCVSLLRDAVKAASRERCDVVLITGDFLDQLASHRETGVEVGLEALSPLLQRGQPVLLILGNHDNSARLLDFRSDLERAGIEVLVNQARTFERDGQRLHFIGLDDLHSGRCDFDQSCSRVPVEEFRIVLQHNPDYIEYHRGGRYDLQISGHFHGGQVRVPLLGAPFVPSRFGRKYLQGLKEYAGRKLYVSRGIGMTIIPLRIDCPSEVSVIELRKGEA